MFEIDREKYKWDEMRERRCEEEYIERSMNE